MTLMKDLLRRRVPQVTAIYLGGCWVLVEFVDFIALRYALSPHLTDLAILFPILLLPSVLLVTYFHGEPGKDQWVWAEKVGIPVNLIVAIGVLVFFVQGKDLGAATTTVTVIDEEGVETERVIPKTEFRRRIAFFYFDSEPSDTAATWLEWGLPNAVVADLNQDQFFDIRNPPLFADRLREAGFPDLTGVPLSLQRQLSEDLHRDQFVAGSVAVVDGEISTTLTLYDVARGRPLAEHTFTGSSVLALADEISVQLRSDLEVPELGNEARRDLPVAEVMTSSLPAYRTFTEAVRRVHTELDYEGAAMDFAKVVEQDPTFAVAQYALAQLYYLTNRTAEAVGPLQAAMEHLYRVPERAQFPIKSDYYLIVRQDMDKALASIEMWADLFPDDVAAYQARIQIQTVRNDRPGMLASMEKILELDPARREMLLQIGDLKQAMGDMEAAREAFQGYADEFPEDHQVLVRLAGISHLQGELEEARDYLDQALLRAPSNVQAMVGLGTAHRTLGDFEGALVQYDAAMAAAGTPEERAQVLGALEGYYSLRGQMDRSIQYLEERMEQVAMYQPGLLATQLRLRAMPGDYVRAGREAEARAEVEAIRGQLPPPFDALVPLGELEIGLALEDADGIEAALPGVESIIQSFQYEILRPELVTAQGRVHELRGEYQEAMELYEEAKRLNPANAAYPLQMGRCYRGLGEYDSAIARFQEALKTSPWGPRINYELALTYEAMGSLDTAREHLERALEVWAEADEGYRPARDAREALARIQG